MYAVFSNDKRWITGNTGADPEPPLPKGPQVTNEAGHLESLPGVGGGGGGACAPVPPAKSAPEITLTWQNWINFGTVWNSWCHKITFKKVRGIPRIHCIVFSIKKNSRIINPCCIHAKFLMVKIRQNQGRSLLPSFKRTNVTHHPLYEKKTILGFMYPIIEKTNEH